MVYIYMYTCQQKKRILLNIHLVLETVIKIYHESYEYVWLGSCVRSGPFDRNYTVSY